MSTDKDSTLAQNKQAFFNYEVLETFEAGLVLVGTEVKSAKDHHVLLRDSYITIQGHEAYLKGCSIALYSHGNINNHEEKRSRKLLLHRKEILKLSQAIQLNGYTIVPLSMYLKKGLIKLKIAICKGKKTYDKREKIKEREEKRSIARLMKS